jgi:ketosteroid isomerase-like protein
VLTRIKRQASRRRQLLAGATAALALFGAAAEARDADNSAAAKAAITDRLHRWTTAFNAQDLAAVCGLFAPDLTYTVDDILNGSRDGLCAGVRAALARRDLKLHYDEPIIHEILVSGDLAVVRLTWTLTTEENGVRDVAREEGMDIFRRAPDGLWSIARYIAFSRRPNALAK